MRLTSRALTGASRPDICIYGLLTARKRAARIWGRELLSHFILFQLVLYVFLYPARVFPYRINVIPSASKLSVTVFELQIAKLLIKHQAALSLQVPHKSRYIHLGRDFQKHMDVIHTAFRFQNIHVIPFAQLS